MKRLGTRIRDGLGMLLLALLLLCALEGLGSFAMAWRQPPREPVVAERLHTEHDPLLGWINKPDQFIPNMYGPGRHLHTNSQRLRARMEYLPEVPPGAVRWVCTGDSFTLGYGVDDDQTWCALLGQTLPDLETVNMGQGGYGIDQAYLWYDRDGGGLEHQLLLFAFVTIDRDRMGDCVFLGHPKPCLAHRDGTLERRNVPVPPPPDRSPPPASGFRRMLQSSRLAAISRRLLNRVLARSREGRLHQLVAAVVRELEQRTRERGATLVLVHLPLQIDHRRSVSGSFRPFLESLSRERNIPYLDLVADLRRLPEAEVPRLFIQYDLPGFAAATGHYTEAGNGFVAERLVEHLRERGLLPPPPSGGSGERQSGATR